MFVPVAVKDQSQRFAGFHDGQVINLVDARAVPGLIEACRSRSPEAGCAAYALRLSRHRPAIPEPRKLAGHPNLFVRYAGAARGPGPSWRGSPDRSWPSTPGGPGSDGRQPAGR